MPADHPEGPNGRRDVEHDDVGGMVGEHGGHVAISASDISISYRLTLSWPPKSGLATELPAVPRGLGELGALAQFCPNLRELRHRLAGKAHLDQFLASRASKGSS